MIDDRTLTRVLPRSAVALLGDVIRATLWMLLIVGLLAYAAVYVRLAALLLARPGSNDFTIFYYTARMVAEGLPMYGDLPEAYRVYWVGGYLGNLNPPHFQLLMAPLVPLGYRGALVAWLTANVFVVAVAWTVTVRELAPRLDTKRVLLTALLVFASAAWTSVAVTGEMSLVLLVPFVLAWRAARRGRWTTAGAWLGMCVAFKPFFLVFPAWLAVTRRWRAAVAAAATTVACVVAGMAVYGVGSYVEWIHGLGRIGWWWLPMNVSLRGLVERVFHAGEPLVPVIDLPSVTRPLWLAGAGVVVGLTAWRTWPGTRTAADPDRLFPVLLVAALLVSPLGWIYYLPLATAPLAALATRRELTGPGWHRAAAFIAGAGLLYLPMELTESGQPSALATLTLASAHSWGALAVWLSLVLPAARVTPEARS